MSCQPEIRGQDTLVPTPAQGEGEEEGGCWGQGTYLVGENGLDLVVQLSAEGGETEALVSWGAGEAWGGGGVGGLGPLLTGSRLSSLRRNAAQSRPPCWARRWRAPPHTRRAAGGSGY